MNIKDLQSDFLSRRPKEDTAHFDSLVAAISNSSLENSRLIEIMVALIKAISDKKEPEIKTPEVNINFDVEALAASLSRQQPEMKAPEIKMEAPVIDMKAIVNEMEARRESISYEFNIKRGSDGKIVSVIANPI